MLIVMEAMGEVAGTLAKRWSGRIVLVYIWTVTVALFAMVVSFAVERLRGCSIMPPHADAGDHFTIAGCIGHDVGRMVLESFSVLVPALALTAALGVTVFAATGRCVRNGITLTMWCAGALLIVIVALSALPNGLYELAPMWASVAIPASASYLREPRWRAAELLAVTVASAFCWFYPLA